MSFRDLMELTPEYWTPIGRKVLAELPRHEHHPFIHWLETHDSECDIYTRFPGEALRRWHDSIERYALDDDPTKVEEGL